MTPDNRFSDHQFRWTSVDLVLHLQRLSFNGRSICWYVAMRLPLGLANTVDLPATATIAGCANNFRPLMGSRADGSPPLMT